MEAGNEGSWWELSFVGRGRLGDRERRRRGEGRNFEF
jgi:hypothetical protein